MIRKQYNGGAWTAARFHSFVTSVLRSGSRKWPPKYETLNSAKTEKKTNPTSGRMAMFYRCNACKEEFPAKGVQVDHKRPIINPKTGFISWDAYIEALFCEKKNLQVLCKECHAIKTKKEKNASK